MEPIIHAVIYGETVLPESMVFLNGSEKMKYPIVLAVFHIRYGEKQILIDAGCDTMPGFEVKNFESPADALRRIQISPEEITDVIITHAHHDHIDGVRHFPNACIHIQKDEYEDGKKYIPEQFRVETFQNRCVVGECVTVEKVGGHSKGSCIARLTKDGVCYVFCGDECYLRLCLERQIPTGVSYCPENSQKFVETYGCKDYRTILSHDPELRDGQIL